MTAAPTRRRALEGTLQWFWERVYAWACARSRRVPRLSFRVGCATVARMRKSSKRAFMHHGHRRGTVCSAPEAAVLQTGHVVGLMLHEIGHPLATALYGRSEQEDADRSVKQILGVVIGYRGPLLLEWVPKSVVREVLGQ